MLCPALPLRPRNEILKIPRLEPGRPNCPVRHRPRPWEGSVCGKGARSGCDGECFHSFFFHIPLSGVLETPSCDLEYGADNVVYSSEYGRRVSDANRPRLEPDKASYFSGGFFTQASARSRPQCLSSIPVLCHMVLRNSTCPRQSMHAYMMVNAFDRDGRLRLGWANALHNRSPAQRLFFPSCNLPEKEGVRT